MRTTESTHTQNDTYSVQPYNSLDKDDINMKFHPNKTITTLKCVRLIALCLHRCISRFIHIYISHAPASFLISV